MQKFFFFFILPYAGFGWNSRSETESSSDWCSSSNLSFNCFWKLGTLVISGEKLSLAVKKKWVNYNEKILISNLQASGLFVFRFEGAGFFV
jgi:hypothetical protein